MNFSKGMVVVAVVANLTGLGGVFVLQGCSATMTKQIVKSVIDVALAACVAEHTEIQDEPALRETCKYADELAPAVKEILSSRSKGMAKLAKAGPSCPQVAPQKDGGL